MSLAVQHYLDMCDVYRKSARDHAKMALRWTLAYFAERGQPPTTYQRDDLAMFERMARSRHALATQAEETADRWLDKAIGAASR